MARRKYLNNQKFCMDELERKARVKFRGFDELHLITDKLNNERLAQQRNATRKKYRELDKKASGLYFDALPALALPTMEVREIPNNSIMQGQSMEMVRKFVRRLNR